METEFTSTPDILKNLLLTFACAYDFADRLAMGRGSGRAIHPSLADRCLGRSLSKKMELGFQFREIYGSSGRQGSRFHCTTYAALFAKSGTFIGHTTSG